MFLTFSNRPRSLRIFEHCPWASLGVRQFSSSHVIFNCQYIEYCTCLSRRTDIMRERLPSLHHGFADVAYSKSRWVHWMWCIAYRTLRNHVEVYVCFMPGVLSDSCRFRQGLVYHWVFIIEIWYSYCLVWPRIRTGIEVAIKLQYVLVLLRVFGAWAMFVADVGSASCAEYV